MSGEVSTTGEYKRETDVVSEKDTDRRIKEASEETNGNSKSKRGEGEERAKVIRSMQSWLFPSFWMSEPVCDVSTSESNLMVSMCDGSLLDGRRCIPVKWRY